jgi:hypothetical protein
MPHCHITSVAVHCQYKGTFLFYLGRRVNQEVKQKNQVENFAHSLTLKTEAISAHFSEMLVDFNETT